MRNVIYLALPMIFSFFQTLMGFYIGLQLAWGAGSEDICKNIFATSRETLVERSFKHMHETGKLSMGEPDALPHLILNADLQVRYYQEKPLVTEQPVQRELKLEVATDMGAFHREDLRAIQRLFPVSSLDIRPIDADNVNIRQWVPIRSLPVDKNTGMLKADSDIVQFVLENLIANHRGDGKTAFLFLDLDNLKLINYFPEGHATGDRYIHEVIRIVSENLRFQDRQDRNHRDIGFRLGGGRDEFVFFLQGANVEILPQIQDRIYKAFREDIKLKEIISSAQADYQTFLRKLEGIPTFRDLESLPAVHSFIKNSLAWQALTFAERGVLRSDSQAFQKFLQDFISSPEAQERSQRFASVQLGASVSVQMIGPDMTYAQLLAVSDRSMQAEKVRRKQAWAESLSPEMQQVDKLDIFIPDF